jgi:hypothetical protein
VMKPEIRMPKAEGSPKSEGRMPKPAWALAGFCGVSFRVSGFGRFGFPSYFGIRISDLPS